MLFLFAAQRGFYPSGGVFSQQCITLSQPVTRLDHRV